MPTSRSFQSDFMKSCNANTKPEYSTRNVTFSQSKEDDLLKRNDFRVLGGTDQFPDFSSSKVNSCSKDGFLNCDNSCCTKDCDTSGMQGRTFSSPSFCFYRRKTSPPPCCKPNNNKQPACCRPVCKACEPCCDPPFSCQSKKIYERGRGFCQRGKTTKKQCGRRSRSVPNISRSNPCCRSLSRSRDRSCRRPNFSKQCTSPCRKKSCQSRCPKTAKQPCRKPCCLYRPPKKCKPVSIAFKNTAWSLEQVEDLKGFLEKATCAETVKIMKAVRDIQEERINKTNTCCSNKCCEQVQCCDDTEKAKAWPISDNFDFKSSVNTKSYLDNIGCMSNSCLDNKRDYTMFDRPSQLEKKKIPNLKESDVNQIIGFLKQSLPPDPAIDVHDAVYSPKISAQTCGRACGTTDVHSSFSEIISDCKRFMGSTKPDIDSLLRENLSFDLEKTAASNSTEKALVLKLDPTSVESQFNTSSNAVDNFCSDLAGNVNMNTSCSEQRSPQVCTSQEVNEIFQRVSEITKTKEVIVDNFQSDKTFNDSIHRIDLNLSNMTCDCGSENVCPHALHSNCMAQKVFTEDNQSTKNSATKETFGNKLATDPIVSVSKAYSVMYDSQNVSKELLNINSCTQELLKRVSDNVKKVESCIQSITSSSLDTHKLSLQSIKSREYDDTPMNSKDGIGGKNNTKLKRNSKEKSSFTGKEQCSLVPEKHKKALRASSGNRNGNKISLINSKNTKLNGILNREHESHGDVSFISKTNKSEDSQLTKGRDCRADRERSATESDKCHSKAIAHDHCDRKSSLWSGEPEECANDMANFFDPTQKNEKCSENDKILKYMENYCTQNGAIKNSSQSKGVEKVKQKDTPSTKERVKNVKHSNRVRNKTPFLHLYKNPHNNKQNGEDSLIVVKTYSAHSPLPNVSLISQSP